MKPTHLTIYTQRGSAGIDLPEHGWIPFPRIGSGFMVFRDSMMWVNGDPGAGSIAFDAIEVTFDAPPTITPRTGWRVTGNTLTIGSGGEAIAPRGMLPIRWAFPPTAPSQVRYGPRTLTWAPAQRRDVYAELAPRLEQTRPTGLWAPYGARQAGPPGADNRATMSGYEQDPVGLTLKSDLTVERMPVACTDVATGAPHYDPDPNYSGDRGWGGTGQHRSFKGGLGGPMTTVGGDCAYLGAMEGLSVYDGWGPFDAQHTGNALSHLTAAARCGDELAQYAIEHLANDLAMMGYGLPRMPRGGRAWAWCCATWWNSRTHHERGVMGIAELMAHGFMRAPASYPFSPTPQSFGMPYDADSEQLMEGCISDHARYLEGNARWVRDALFNSPAPYRTKFVQRGRNQNEVLQHYANPCGNGDFFFPDIPYGICLLHNPEDREVWDLAMQTYSVATMVELRDALRNKQYGHEQHAVLQAVVEGMS